MMTGIEARRKALNMTQRELANALAVSQANISQWESGVASPRADKLPEIAKVLQCQIEDLYGVGAGCTLTSC